MESENNLGRITTQVRLAELVPCSPVTLSKAKTIKGYVSLEKYNRLSTLTGIDRDLWSCGSRRKLSAQLRRFFKSQKFGGR